MIFLRRWSWLILLILFPFTAFYASGIDAGSSHDRLKYLSIAWSMYQNSDYLIPTVNGIPYTDKPPLLFWLISASWHLFGVNMFGPQLIIMSIYIAWGLLTRAIYATLFSYDSLGKDLVPYVLLGSFTIWQGMWFLRVDLLLVTGILLCNLGIIRLFNTRIAILEKKKNIISWFLISLGTCIGLFGKGPVVYIFTFLPFLVSAIFVKDYRRFIVKITSATLIGTFMMLAFWAAPAVIFMGYDFAQQIFYRQIAHRAIQTGVTPYVKRSYFIYVYQYFPTLFLPWIINIVFFKKIKQVFQQAGSAAPFIASIFIISLLILSCFGQKTAWYILPLLPLGVLLFTRFFVEYKEVLSVILLNRIVLGSCFLALSIVNVAFIISPDFLHHSFKNFGGDFIFEPAWMVSLAILNALTSIYLFFSKNFIRGIMTASMMFFIVYGAMNVYFSSFEKNFTHIQQVGEILHQQETNENGIVLYNTGVPGETLDYLGQLNYVARLKQVILILKQLDALKIWLKEHPNGMVIYSGESCPEVGNLHILATYRERNGATPYLLCQENAKA